MNVSILAIDSQHVKKHKLGKTKLKTALVNVEMLVVSEQNSGYAFWK